MDEVIEGSKEYYQLLEDKTCPYCFSELVEVIDKLPYGDAYIPRSELHCMYCHEI